MPNKMATMQGCCCEDDPMITTCAEAEALLATVTSADIVVPVVDGTCTGCSAISGGFNLSPVSCGGFGTYLYCFNYTFSGGALSCPPLTFNLIGAVWELNWVCNINSITMALGSNSNVFGAVWRKSLVLPLPRSQILSGLLDEDFDGRCNTDGQASWTYNI